RLHTFPTRRSSDLVVPYWNAGVFLAETIDSVRAQAFQHWELVLVDDGSSDDSPRTAAEAAAADPRIRVAAHPEGGNRGQSAARNVGLAMARGDLVAFLDADDVWLPERLSVEVDLLDAHPDVDIVYGPYVFWRTWSGDPGAKDVVARVGSGHDCDRVLDPPYLVWRHVAYGNGIPVPSGALVRTAVARRVGGFEAREFPGMYDDESFFAKVLLQGRAWVHQVPLYRYRQHAASYCARAIAAGTWDPARVAVSPVTLRILSWLVGGWSSGTYYIAARLSNRV